MYCNDYVVSLNVSVFRCLVTLAAFTTIAVSCQSGSVATICVHAAFVEAVLFKACKTLTAQVTAWFAPQFAELRRRVCVGGEGAYVASLSRCRPWEASGGKTRAYFAKTCDDRYIVKQLQPSEKRSFPDIAPSYFRYLAHAMRRRLPTCLARIMGIYTVRTH